MTLARKTGFLAIIAIALVLSMASTGICKKSGYNYITVEEVKNRIDAGDVANGSMVITTSQTEKEYKTGFIKEAHPTFARPLKTDADFAKLEPFYAEVKDADSDIIFICPRGKSGAERPYDYFKKHGVAESRLFVMEGGQEAFNKAFPDAVSYPAQ